MNRRDFLSLRATPRGRTLEFSCRRFYTRFLDSEHLATAGCGLAELDAEAPAGGPPAAVVMRATAFLLRQLDQDLRDVQVLRLLDRDWQSPPGFGDGLESVLARFQARGGIVEVEPSVR